MTEDELGPGSLTRDVKQLIDLNIRELQACEPEEIVIRMLKSEEIYVNKVLFTIVDGYENRLRNSIKMGKTIVSEDQINQLFLNISSIFNFNKEFLEDLRSLGFSGKLLTNIAPAMEKLIPFFKIYAMYIYNHENSKELYQGLKKNRKFVEFAKINEVNFGVRLFTLLGVPIARLPHYLIYLAALSFKLPDSNPIKPQIQVVIGKIKDVTDSIAQQMLENTARRRVVEIQTDFFKSAIDIVEPHRKLLRLGVLKQLFPDRLLFGKEKVTVILFNDMMIVASLAGKPKRVVRLEFLTVRSLLDDKYMKNAMCIESTSGEKFFFKGPLPMSRDQWVDAFAAAIADAKEAMSGHARVDPDYFEKMILGKVPKINVIIPTAKLRLIYTEIEESHVRGAAAFEDNDEDDVPPPPPPVSEFEENSAPVVKKALAGKSAPAAPSVTRASASSQPSHVAAPPPPSAVAPPMADAYVPPPAAVGRLPPPAAPPGKAPPPPAPAPTPAPSGRTPPPAAPAGRAPPPAAPAGRAPPPAAPAAPASRAPAPAAPVAPPGRAPPPAVPAVPAGRAVPPPPGPPAGRSAPPPPGPPNATAPPPPAHSAGHTAPPPGKAPSAPPPPPAPGPPAPGGVPPPAPGPPAPGGVPPPAAGGRMDLLADIRRGKALKKVGSSSDTEPMGTKADKGGSSTSSSGKPPGGKGAPAGGGTLQDELQAQLNMFRKFVRHSDADKCGDDDW